jgi:hypothetical protein
MADDFDTEWDDGCPGLVEILARETEWKAQESSNDVVQWGVSGVDGWEVTSSASPVEEAWPGIVVDERCGTWPSSSEIVLTHADGWPILSANIEGGIEVTIEVCTDIGEFQGEHSACRFDDIGCFLVTDLLSFLCHR